MDKNQIYLENPETGPGSFRLVSADDRKPKTENTMKALGKLRVIRFKE